MNHRIFFGLTSYEKDQKSKFFKQLILMNVQNIVLVSPFLRKECIF